MKITLVCLSLLFLVSCKPLKLITIQGTIYGNDTLIGAGQSNMQRLDLNLVKNQAAGVGYTWNIAVGGSTLDQWTPGTPYYASLVQTLKTSNGNITLLWMQGEAEGLGTPGTNPYTWATRFSDIIRQARTDSNKDFKVIMVKIGLPSYGTLWDEVRTQQDQVSFPGLYKVYIDDVPRNDGVHYDSAGYVEIAKRIAAVYNQN